MAAQAIAPLVVIVGPTASGKTSLAIDVALRHSGEIICADSRTVYKCMDIGTAKPTAAEQKLVPHFGLDLVQPGERFTAADFKRYAVEKIAEIRARGHVPILVGGTGLYVDAVIFDYQFGADVDQDLRGQLMAMTLEQLQQYCRDHDISLPENEKNKRYIIRAIETVTTVKKRRHELIDNTIVVGIATDKVLLRSRIEKRAEQLFEDGVVKEAKQLGKKYGWESESMTSNIYPLLRAYSEGVLSLDEVKGKSAILDWRLAKRQMTWLKRNPFIHWASLDEAKIYLDQRLVKPE